MRIFQASLCVSCFQTLAAHLYDASLENVASSRLNVHHHVSQSDSSSHLFLPPSSPDCWLDTLQELYPQDDIHGNGQRKLDLSTCLKLDTHHQQALALRLTKCHLESMGRSLVSTEDANSCEDLHHPRGVKRCLFNLTTTAATTYTLFFNDLHYVCTRLLQESVTNRYYRTTQDLEQVSKLAGDRLQSILQQQEESSVFWKEKEERMTQWFHEQTQLTANQALEFQEQMRSKQQEDLHRHKEELQSLADALQTTKTSIQPWTQLVDLLFRFIPIGYSILKIAATMLGPMIIIMIMTHHKQLRRVRFKLFVVVLLGGLGELVVLWLENQNEIDLTATERLKLSEWWQNFLMSFLCACYLSSLFSFCCGRKPDPQDDEADEDDSEEVALPDRTAVLHREIELLERLRLQRYQQEHWNAMTAQHQLQQQHEQRQATLPNVNAGRSHRRPPSSFLMTSSAPPPPLIHSPESGSCASATSAFVAAPWNVPPSPWTPNCPIAVYPDAITSNGNTILYATKNHNDEYNLPPIQDTADLPLEEPDDEKESDETKDGAVFDNRKRTYLEMEESNDEDSDTEEGLPVAKKRRAA